MKTFWIWCSLPTLQFFREVAILDPIHDLDHLPIYCEIDFKVKVKRKTQRRVWHYENGNYDALKNCLMKPLGTFYWGIVTKWTKWLKCFRIY